ncbi:MAG: response regulator [Synergistaceae bacterium]|nr:response regulator [Synergistaceae bacterium]
MRKVLICDDEFLIRAGLEITMPWEEHGLYVVGAAKNGKEAVEMYDEFLPEIVITDIKMPVIDGLELLKILKAKRKDLIVILLSHYDDFVYVKEALNCGAADYILKSQISPDNLMDVIDNHIAEQGDPIQEDKTAPHEHDAAVRETIRGLFHEKDSDSNILEAALAGKQYVAAVAALYYSKEQSDKTDIILKSLGSVLKNKLNKYQQFISFPANNIMCGVFYDGLCESPINPIAIAKNIQNVLREFLNLELLVGVSDVSFEPERLKRTIDDARRRNRIAFFKEDMIAVSESDTPAPLETDAELPNYAQLRNLFEKCNDEDILNSIDRYCDVLYVSGDIGSVRNFYANLRALLDYLRIKERKNRDNEFSRAMYEMRPFESQCGFFRFREEVLLACSSLVRGKSTKKQEYSPIVKNCLNYIHKNYHNNITLTDVANYARSSRSYLSSLFRQETGVKFTAYLNKYRLEKAKELLANSGYLFYEISEMVGFDNAYYFSKIFKETYGVSCKDYRRSCLNERESE